MVKGKKKIDQITTLDIRSAVKHPKAFPWDIKTGSIDEAVCIGILEFIPGKIRGAFMDEIFRVLKPGGKCQVVVPYWNTQAAIQDYRHEWPPMTEQSFLYFNKAWREQNKLDIGLKCDFEFNYGYNFDAEMMARNDEGKAFYIKHYTNSVQALQIMLIKK